MEEQAVQTNKGTKLSFVGLVTSDKMDKTIVVTVSTKRMDRLYKKYVTRTKKYKAHDAIKSVLLNVARLAKISAGVLQKSLNVRNKVKE